MYVEGHPNNLLPIWLVLNHSLWVVSSLVSQVIYDPSDLYGGVKSPISDRTTKAGNIAIISIQDVCPLSPRKVGGELRWFATNRASSSITSPINSSALSNSIYLDPLIGKCPFLSIPTILSGGASWGFLKNVLSNSAPPLFCTIYNMEKGELSSYPSETQPHTPCHLKY